MIFKLNHYAFEFYCETWYLSMGYRFSIFRPGPEVCSLAHYSDKWQPFEISHLAMGGRGPVAGGKREGPAREIITQLC